MDERTTLSKFTSNVAAKSKSKDELKLEPHWAGRVPHQDWITLNATKTGVVYRLLGKRPNGPRMKHGTKMSDGHDLA